VSDMTTEQAAALRKPFDKKAVGKLPKPYKADSEKGNCRECGGYHGLPAMHLDYVGHAAVTTDRLLAVDPEWTWEPMATDEYGNPQPDAAGNLWIRLTVCGVTRIGVGDGATMKIRIGDAIRNAAMRFGVALDLWSKEELEIGELFAHRLRRPRAWASRPSSAARRLGVRVRQGRLKILAHRFPDVPNHGDITKSTGRRSSPSTSSRAAHPAKT
jgi:hypothetical protein